MKLKGNVKRIAFVAAALLLTSCAKISEPWVPGNQLSDERDRTVQEAKQLRDRLATSQIDR